MDEDALICDLAETYGIYNYRSLPASLVATYSVGLREDSRIKRKMRGDRLTYTEALLAMIHDLLANFIWAVYGSGEAPKSLFDELNGTSVKPTPKNRGFDSPEAFEAERQRILKG